MKFSIDFNNVIAILLFICDTYGSMVHPCPGNRVACVRNYFVNHGHCRLPHATVPALAMRSDVLTVPFAHINATCLIENLVVSNFNGKIINFFVNPKTNNTVLTVAFPGLKFYSPKVIFLFHRLGVEPVRVLDYGTAKFSLVIATGTIPDADDLQMKKAFVAACCRDLYPEMSLGPNIVYNLQARSYVDKLLADIPNDVLHLLDGIMPFAFQMFVKYRICDFGTPPKFNRKRNKY